MTKQNPLWMQTTTGAPTYSARLDRMLIYNLFTEGVLSGFLVSQRAAGANMTVDVSIGYAVVYGDDQANQGAYLFQDDAVDSVTISAAPGSNKRIDLVYARINDPNAGGPSGLNFTLGVVNGTASASPTVPALPTSAIPLAQILVTAGNVSVINSMITDARVGARTRGSAPFGSVVDYTGVEASVDADWLLSYGQAVSRTVYFGLFQKIGTTHGVGDGTSTFNLPDYRGLVGFGLDNMGGSDRGKISAANILGSVVGEETHLLTTTEMPTHNHGVNDSGHNHLYTRTTDTHQNFTGASDVSAGSFHVQIDTTSDVTSAQPTGITIQSNGSSGAHNNVQPSIQINKIIRAL